MSETTKQRFTGRDVTEALAAARRAFGVERGQIAHEVVARREVGPVDDPRALIEIEAWVDPQRVPPVSREPEARGPRRDRGDRGGHGGDRDRRGGGFGGERGGRGERGTRGERGGREERGGPGRAGVVGELPEVPPVELLPSPGISDADTILTTLGNGLVQGLGLELAVARVSTNEAGCRIHLEGADAGLLIENGAAGLDALQYLANRVLQKDKRVEAKLTIDAGGWREENEQHLIAEARRIAAEVQHSGGDRALLEPLSPYERRLVHVALADMEGVRTYSSGTGYARRLHIAKS
jgi:spoIIIJ-associated protein